MDLYVKWNFYSLVNVDTYTQANVKSYSNHSTAEELIGFHCEVMESLLQQVANQRLLKENPQGKAFFSDRARNPKVLKNQSNSVVDEICEVIDAGSSISNLDWNQDLVELSVSVKKQLRMYVSQIASMYKVNNPFHNFEHASHVTFAAYQLLQRVISSESINTQTTKKVDGADPWEELPFDLEAANNSDGLSGDALAQFAVVFSALIHDVEHQGVSNPQLAKENPEFAKKYQNKSIAEQNSVEVAWCLLEDDTFSDLRASIFPNEYERERFRKMVINIVIATDIFDPNLRDFRERKWVRAFSSDNLQSLVEDEEKGSEGRKRRATVVLDLVMQAADISHTMQPFSTYTKWNQRLYHEMYAAFLEGRSPSDPSEKWVNGEIWFFDNHVIPLAARLKESGAFGASGDVLLMNAKRNKEAWQRRGEDVFKAIQKEVFQKLNVGEVVAPTSTLSSVVSVFCCRSRRGTFARSTEGHEKANDEDDATESETEDEESLEGRPLWRARAA